MKFGRSLIALLALLLIGFTLQCSILPFCHTVHQISFEETFDITSTQTNAKKVIEEFLEIKTLELHHRGFTIIRMIGDMKLLREEGKIKVKITIFYKAG